MRKIVTSLSSAAVIAVAISMLLAADKSSGVKPGDEAPAFSLQDQDGKTVSLSDFKGKTVVLEWFNSECPYVKRHYKAKTMNDAADKWKDKDVVWLAINTTAGKSVSDNKAVFSDWSVNHPILADSDSSVAKAYGAKTTPHMFIIDKQGKIAYEGAIDNDPDGNKGADKINYVDKALTELSTGSSVSVPETRSYGCGVHYR